MKSVLWSNRLSERRLKDPVLSLKANAHSYLDEGFYGSEWERQKVRIVKRFIRLILALTSSRRSDPQHEAT